MLTISRSASNGHQLTITRPNGKGMLAQLGLSDGEFKQLCTQVLDYLEIAPDKALQPDTLAWLMGVPVAELNANPVQQQVQHIIKSLPNVQFAEFESPNGDSVTLIGAFKHPTIGSNYRITVQVSAGSPTRPQFIFRQLGTIGEGDYTSLAHLIDLTK